MKHKEDLSETFADDISYLGRKKGGVTTKSAAAGVPSWLELDDTDVMLEAFEEEEGQPDLGGLGAYAPQSQKQKKAEPLSSPKRPPPRESPGLFQVWPAKPYRVARESPHEYHAGQASGNYDKLMEMSAEDLRNLCRREGCGVPRTKKEMAERLDARGVRAPPKPKKRIKKKDRSAKSTKKKPPPVAQKKKKKKAKGKKKLTRRSLTKKLLYGGAELIVGDRIYRDPGGQQGTAKRLFPAWPGGGGVGIVWDGEEEAKFFDYLNKLGKNTYSIKKIRS
jgi:hypothetical protein